MRALGCSILLVLGACSGADSGIPDADPDEQPDARVAPDAGPETRVVKLNEVYKKQPGTDAQEFLEIVGDAVTAYDDLTIVVIESDAGPTAGAIKLAYEVGTTDADGLYATPFTEEMLSNGSITVMLVRGFSGAVDDDLDADDDGTLDAEPWQHVFDSVSLIDDALAVAYSAEVIDGTAADPDGAARFPDGAATWVPHDPEGHGLEALCASCGTGAAVPGSALVTPGAPNALAGAAGPLLNEVYKKQPGTDFHEFIEIAGAPATDYATYTIVVLESDVGTTSAGVIDLQYTVGTTNAAGFYATPFTNETLENASLTVLLVTGYTGAVATDLDTDDDGTLDLTPWTAIVDSIAVIDGTGNAYSPTVITNDFDASGAGEPDGVARTPAWTRHDPNGNGLVGVAGEGGNPCAGCGATAAVSGTAIVTPGAANTVAP